MKKREILNALQEMAFAAEVLDEQKWNARGLGAASWTLRTVDGELDEMHRSGELAKRQDIVKQAKEVVGALVDHGRHEGMDELMARVPAGLLDIRRIKGLGPKKVRVLWQELGLTSLTELEYACTENRLVEVKGFGKKTQDKVLEGIEEVRSYLGRFRLDHGTLLAQRLLTLLEGVVDRIEIAGHLRRATETLASFDYVAAADAAELAAALAAFEPVIDDDKACIRFVFEGAQSAIHLVPAGDAGERRFGAALVFATGSEAHLALLQARAEEQGLQLRREGLFEEQVLLDTPEEADVYAALGLLVTEPERREANVPLALRGQARAVLVEREDLQGALHNHTIASDGIHTLEQMRQGAIDRGLRYFGITEHSQTASYAGGLTLEGLQAQRSAVDELNRDALGEQCRLVFGIESDILAGGELDYPDEVLQSLDVVVASVHTRHSQDVDAMTQRMVQAAKNPETDIIGHPTGRMLLGRSPSAYDIGAMLDACAESGCAVELNAQPARLDLNEVHLAMAKERGLFVSIAADAHSVEAIDYLDYGVLIARRAGLRAEDVLNCKSYDELMTWLKTRSARVGTSA